MEFLIGAVLGLIAGVLIGAKHKARVDAAKAKAEAEIDKFKK